MKLVKIDLSLVFKLLIFMLAVSLHGCKSGSESGAAQNLDEVTDQPLIAVVLTQIAISDYVVVSSRRVGRTAFEYTLRAIATNSSSNKYTNVTAALMSVPENITIIDGDVAFGTVFGNSNNTSADEFTIEVDLSVNTSLIDLVWQVSGATSGTGGGGTTSPTDAGMFMSIDGKSEIKGDSTSESHKDWIELQSFQEGSSIVGGDTLGGGQSSGKVNLDGVTVSKLLDSSSPQLRQALVDGSIFTEVMIDIVKSCGGNVYTAYAITLTVSVMTSLNMSSGGERPIEKIVFDYSRIETMFTPVDGSCRLGSPVYSFQDALKI